MVMNLSRRGFVTLGAAAVGSLATTPAFAAKLIHPKAHNPSTATTTRHKLHATARAAEAPTAAFPVQPNAKGERFVHLVNAHTNESLEGVYWRDGRYLPDAMHQVNRVLRDHMSGDSRVMDPRLIDLLGDLRRAVGTSEPFTVISGYRSPRTNAWMHRHSRGVAAHSLHIKGQAADIVLTDANVDTLHNAALELGEGGVGYYPRSGFVHVDTGAVREWAFE